MTASRGSSIPRLQVVVVDVRRHGLPLVHLHASVGPVEHAVEQRPVDGVEDEVQRDVEEEERQPHDPLDQRQPVELVDGERCHHIGLHNRAVDVKKGCGRRGRSRRGSGRGSARQ